MVSESRRLAVVVLAVVLSAGVIPAIGAADPPTGPDHGLNTTEFAPLWSHDADRTNVSGSVTAIRALANGTDISYAEPPAAVRQWNRGDLQEFPDTDTDRSIYPTGTETTSSDRGWITDAYARVFAIQPSTRAYVSPSQQPLYVPPNGSVLATIDYRVELPDDDTSGDKRTFYELTTVRITWVRSVSGARVLGSTSPAHAVTVPYQGLAAGTHQLGVEAQIEIEVAKTVKTRHCEDEDDDGDEECHWESSTYSIVDYVVVRDTRPVERYTTLSTGYITQYPDGDMGVIAQQNHPWAGLSLPSNDSVAGVWRFYSGRDPAWDVLTVASEDGTDRRRSPLRPLQTYAYPSTEQARLVTDGNAFSARGSILQSRGPTRQAPSLPPSVTLPTANGTYNASTQIGVRHPAFAPGEVQVQGLVAGTSRRLSPSTYTAVETRESVINATVTNATSTTVTIHVQLFEKSGGPITTKGYDGRVMVGGTQVETNATGEATVTVARREQRLPVAYEPAPFWERAPAYTPATAHVIPPTSFGGNISTLVSLALSTLLLWLPVYMFDRMLNLDIWPPWKRIW